MDKDTLPITIKQTSKALNYHKMKSELLAKYLKKKRELGLQRKKLNAVGTPSEGEVVMVDIRAEKKLQDKLSRLEKNLLDITRKLKEQDRIEKARRRKVRRKREEMMKRSREGLTTLSLPISSKHVVIGKRFSLHLDI